MYLDLNVNGRMVIKEITEEALNYIESERRKLTDPSFDKFPFSNNYEGTMYVSVKEEENKADAVWMLDELIGRHGLVVTPFAKIVLKAWRREAHMQRKAEQAMTAVDDCARIRRVLKEGCRGCIDFRLRANGDDDVGVCTANGEKVLAESPLSFKYGGYDGDGVFHPGTKYYPHEGCKYLSNERKLHEHL